MHVGSLQECIAASFLVINPNDINEVREKVVALQEGRKLRKRDIKAKNKIWVKLNTIRKGEEKHQIQKCIGQVAIDFYGNGKMRYGTGTIYKHLGGKYYLAITAASNLVFVNDKICEQERTNKVFYLPYGLKDQSVRLLCVDWITHESFNARVDHDENDIGIVLCWDGLKHYRKQKVKVNDCVRIEASCQDQLTDCNIYGYPVQFGGQLMGSVGTAKKYKNEW
eukprot:96333_1